MTYVGFWYEDTFHVGFRPSHVECQMYVGIHLHTHTHMHTPATPDSLIEYQYVDTYDVCRFLIQRYIPRRFSSIARRHVGIYLHTHTHTHTDTQTHRHTDTQTHEFISSLMGICSNYIHLKTGCSTSKKKPNKYTMGIRADIRNEVHKEMATKIFGQPKLIVITAAIPTSLGGGNYGHAGMIIDQAKYLLMTGTPFNNPQNPGVYPTNIAENAANGVRARKEALHKELIREYEIYCGVEQTLKDIILKAINNDYLLEIEDKILGYLNQAPRQMIALLCNRGGQLNFTDTKKLYPNGTPNGMPTKSPKCTLTESKRQSDNLNQPASSQTSMKEGIDRNCDVLPLSLEDLLN
jgi:hypothetical protein